MNGKVHLWQRGSAARMDIHMNAGKIFWGPTFYSVNIIPAFDVNGCLYIAKPWKYQAMPLYCWRKSYDHDEKMKLDESERSNGCNKQVLRILKIMRNKDIELSLLSSFHFKAALFREMDDESLSWTCRDVGRRVMGVLGQLEAALKSKYLPHYFVSKFNLLDGMHSTGLDNMLSRLQRIRRLEREMMHVLNS